jgi:hypothetical protein
MCALAATSGTTPPVRLWASVWELMTKDNSENFGALEFKAPCNTAAAVSSQLDSMAKILTD